MMSQSEAQFLEAQIRKMLKQKGGLSIAQMYTALGEQYTISQVAHRMNRMFDADALINLTAEKGRYRVFGLPQNVVIKRGLLRPAEPTDPALDAIGEAFREFIRPIVAELLDEALASKSATS